MTFLLFFLIIVYVSSESRGHNHRWAYKDTIATREHDRKNVNENKKKKKQAPRNLLRSLRLRQCSIMFERYIKKSPYQWKISNSI